MYILNYLLLFIFTGIIVSGAPAPIKKRGYVTLYSTINVQAPATAAALPTTTAIPVPPPAPAAIGPATTAAAVAITPVVPAAAAVPTTTQAPVAAAVPTISVAAAVAAPVVSPAAVAPAAVTTAAAAAPATTTSSSGGLLSSVGKAISSAFSAFFGTLDDDDTTSTTAVTTPVSTPAAAAVPVVSTPVAAVSPTYAPTTLTTSTYSSENLFDFLFGDSSGSGSSSVAAAAAPLVAPSVSAGLAGSSVQSSLPVTSSVSASNPLVSSGTGSNAAYAPSIKAAQSAKGITYSPYTEANACKTAAQVAYDIDQLSNFDLIRLYATDCSGIQNVIAALQSHQQLFLGIWDIDDASVTSGLEVIQQSVGTTSRGWSIVHTISIGNEQVNSGTATPAQIQVAVAAARSWLQANASQYTGYVVSVDTLVAVVSNPSLCQYSDYLAVNCHPYWDGGVEPGNSGPWLQAQIANLESVCNNGKSVLITETGWPTQGDTFGTDGVPSIPNQTSALQSIMSVLSSQVIAFTLYNDYWKEPGPQNVEQHWGIYGNPAA
ncbi:glycoside hydrolase superfamily [Scheffersomyces coipomensis]|uniref:glycoside hydrolase superfamily n=1 Tax=Scheffersomyces coipomensis TaxID=1788519 RepID=UPI00315DE47C